MNPENSLSKPYLIGVRALTIIVPAVSVFINWLIVRSLPISVETMGKWFIFWAVGLRLFIVGLRQVFNPAFTAKTIFHLSDTGSYVIVKELGFANICFGLIGMLSLLIPQWRIVSAFGSGIFYGIAGINHLVQKNTGANEKVALLSDLLIFFLLLIYFLMLQFNCSHFS